TADNAGDGLGASVASAGITGPLDFNGDGAADIAVMTQSQIDIITSAAGHAPAGLPAVGSAVTMSQLQPMVVTNQLNPNQDLTGFQLVAAGNMLLPGNQKSVNTLLLSGPTTSYLIPGTTSPPSQTTLGDVALQFPAGGLVPLGDVNGDGSADLGAVTTLST